MNIVQIFSICHIDYPNLDPILLYCWDIAQILATYWSDIDHIFTKTFSIHFFYIFEILFRYCPIITHILSLYFQNNVKDKCHNMMYMIPQYWQNIFQILTKYCPYIFHLCSKNIVYVFTLNFVLSPYYHNWATGLLCISNCIVL